MKYNTKKGTVSPTTTTNERGEAAYVLSAREELVATVLTTFLDDSYYESGNQVAKRIVDAASKVDALFVAKLAIYARTKANMRSVSHLLAGELAKRVSGTEWGKRFYYKVVSRPDDMSEIVGYLLHTQGKHAGPPNAIIKGFREYMEGMTPYQIDKYKMKTRGISLVDLLRLIHPRHKGKPNHEAWERLAKGESLEGLYEAPTLAASLSKAGQTAKLEGVDEEVADELKGVALVQALESPKGMPYMALLRNLRNILNYAPEALPTAISQLTDKKRVLNSKQLPFRFLSAYKSIEEVRPNQTKPTGISFEKGEDGKMITQRQVDETLAAIEKAFDYSVENIPKLPGNTAVLIDRSGSMRGDAGGASKLSSYGKTTTVDIADLFGSMMMHSQDNVYVGLFGDKLVNLPIDRSMGTLKFAEHIHNTGAYCGAHTEAGIYEFLRTCIANKTKVDNLIIFSDQVIGEDGSAKGRSGLTGWYGIDNTDRILGPGGTFQKLFMEFKKINPRCNVISVDIRATSGKSVFHKSMGITQVAGWSNEIFTIIDGATKGYDALIKEIEGINI